MKLYWSMRLAKIGERSVVFTDEDRQCNHNEENNNHYYTFIHVRQW